MVDDRVDGAVDPPGHVLAVRVVAVLLERGVEHPEVRGGIGSGAGSPLPPVVVRREISVDQVLHEPAGPPLPREMEVLDQEARDDHPDAVVHPAGRQELTHPGVDDSEARLTGAPLRELGVGRRVGVEFDVVQFGVQVLPRGVRLVEEHVGVEVSPRQLTGEHGVPALPRARGVEVGEQRAGVDGSPLQVRRQLARPPQRRAITQVVVGVDAGTHRAVGSTRGVEESPPPVERGRLAGVGEVALRVRPVGQAVGFDAGGAGTGPLHVAAGCVVRAFPPGSTPHLGERGEHGVGITVTFSNPARIDGVGRPDATELSAVLGERFGDRGITRPSVGCVVAAHDDRARIELVGERRDHLGRVTVADDESRPRGLPE